MVGIPISTPPNQSKIVFSTRSQQVCREMKAHKTVEVACLDFDAAWTLFSKEAGEETLNSHPHIPSLAQVVVNACRGLPLALVTLGRAMAAERDILSWEKVAQDLKKFPAAISGMENQLFHQLKLSYDRLPDNVLKSCFLYSSMLPEDWHTNSGFLRDLWIGEGFLGMVDDINETRDQCDRIIETLKQACLLESVDSTIERVKLHDVIRDMALWLYSECGAKKNKVQVYYRVDMPFKDLGTSKQKEVEKISIWEINVRVFDEILVCPNIKTLLVAECKKLKRFSNEFFHFMPQLRVLNLSGNVNLTKLPPGIGELNALTYLNLSLTGIKELPPKLKQLKNLMILHMTRMHTPVVHIPVGLISSLISLKSLGLYGTKIPIEVEVILLQELESLDCLSDVEINISSVLSFNKLKSSHKLLRYVSCVNLYELRDTILLGLSSGFKRALLQSISICCCEELEGVKISIEQEGIQSDLAMSNKNGIKEKCFPNLKSKYISDCPKLLDLTWFVHLPFLEDLNVEDCELLNEVLQDKGSVHEIKEKLDIFSRLRYLRLCMLPTLESIYWRPLLLPSLEILEVYECESLTSLPFDSNTSTNNLKKVIGETSWWNQLEWNVESVKRSFTRYFESVEPEAYSTDSEENFIDRTIDGAEEEPNDMLK